MAEEAPVFTRREVNRALLAAAVACVAAPRLAFAAAPARRLFDFALAGGHHHGLYAALPGLRPGVILQLVREAQNPHDFDAVAVHSADGLKLGYVPRAANTPIAALLDRGEALRAEIIRMLDLKSAVEIPPDLVFTAFASGDPMIRLTAS
jgi:hypothetical protein